MASNKVNVLVVNSGGMDSTVLVYDLLDQGLEVSTISFDYGQRHRKELEYAERTALRLGLAWHCIELQSIADILAVSGSSLVSDTPVPEGHYAEENMKKTVVPNRNMMMLSIAGSVAVATGGNFIATGVHAGDHAVYPDCRPQFIAAVSEALVVGNEGFGKMQGVLSPYVNISKAQIARKGILLGVPFKKTWSCYVGGENHCGRCGTCVERLEAIEEATLMLKVEGNPIVSDWYDETVYEDTEFWRNAVEENK